MTRPYSKDLRKRVVAYILLGNSYASASRKYEVSAAACRNWYLRYKDTGSIDPLPYPGSKSKIKKSEFISYVELHPGCTLKQIGIRFGMTARGAFYYMRKFGFKYKKKSHVIRKQKQVNEPNI